MINQIGFRNVAKNYPVITYLLKLSLRFLGRRPRYGFPGYLVCVIGVFMHVSTIVPHQKAIHQMDDGAIHVVLLTLYRRSILSKILYSHSGCYNSGVRSCPNVECKVQICHSGRYACSTIHSSYQWGI